MFHFKIKNRHFEKIGEVSSLFPLSNYFFYIFMPSLFFNPIIFICLLQFLFPHLHPFHSPRMVYPSTDVMPTLTLFILNDYRVKTLQEKKNKLMTETAQSRGTIQLLLISFSGHLIPKQYQKQ